MPGREGKILAQSCKAVFTAPLLIYIMMIFG